MLHSALKNFYKVTKISIRVLVVWGPHTLLLPLYKKNIIQVYQLLFLLHNRVCRHEGISFRTKDSLNVPCHPKIREYWAKWKFSIDTVNFKILLSVSDEAVPKIIDSIFIAITIPCLIDLQCTAELVSIITYVSQVFFCVVFDG